MNKIDYKRLFDEKIAEYILTFHPTDPFSKIILEKFSGYSIPIIAKTLAKVRDICHEGAHDADVFVWMQYILSSEILFPKASPKTLIGLEASRLYPVRVTASRERTLGRIKRNLFF